MMLLNPLRTVTPHPLFRCMAVSRISTMTTSTRPLAGTHAIITGASRGIGLATAHHLARLGCKLTLISRSASALQSAAASLPNPSMHTPIPGDISSRTFWSDLPVPKDKRIDILVNAAGISHQSLFVRTTEDLIEDVVRTNLMGTMWGCRAVGRRMLRQKGGAAAEPGEDAGPAGEDGVSKVRAAMGKGVIINVASLLGLQGGMGSAAYAASKAGVVGFSRALAAEMGPGGVRVNTVLPGYVTTDMTDAMSPGAREQALDRIPLKRFGTADEVADAILFLIMNAYAHNCVLNLDGGLSSTVSRCLCIQRKKFIADVTK